MFHDRPKLAAPSASSKPRAFARHALQLALFVIGILLLFPTSAFADVTVEVSVSQRQVDVGVPVILSIKISNADSYQRPEIPEVPGAAIQPVPGSQKSSMTTIINGQVTQQSSETLTYRIVPDRAGTLTIPAFDIVAGGKTFTSQPIDIIVSKSEAGDLLMAAVVADSKTVFLGQPLNLTLQIWIKPYQDKRMNLRLNASDMWSLIDLGSSSWGDFGDTLAKLRDPFGGLRISAQEVLHQDKDGNTSAYYQYDIPMTLWPSQAGTLKIDQPRIVMTYPLRLARQDSFFPTGRLAVAESRVISIPAELPDVVVKAPPTANQPDTYSGAVGKFDIAVEAKPTDVSVGDPITLTIKVFDHGNGETRLDLLAPPPLDRNDELTKNFKLPSDPLAGSVSGKVKTFTQTIRPKNESVARIPPIAFSFFNPETQQYESRQSDPISIAVKPGSQVGLNEVVQSPGLAAPAPTSDLKEVTGGLLANDTDPESLLQSQQFRMNWLAWCLLLLPPAVFFLISAKRVAAGVRGRNPHAIRRRNARKRALARIRGTRKADPRTQAQAIAAAMGDYIADRLNLTSGSLTSSEAVRALRTQRVNDDHINDINRLLEDCERLSYAGGGDLAGQDDLINRASMCVNALERIKLNGAAHGQSFAATHRSAMLLMFAVLAALATIARADPLSSQQLRSVLDEAQTAYDKGIAALRTNPTQARASFKDAAARFQLIADNGIANGPLFYDLANAYLQAGDVGNAILNYRRAEKFTPGDARLQSNLHYARTLCRSQITPSGERQLTKALLAWHENTPLWWRFDGFVAANLVFWLLSIIWIVRPGGWVRAGTIAVGVLWLVLGASVLADVSGLARRPVGVLIADDVTVRKGNGDGFEPRFEQPLHAGVEFTVLERRGDWLQVQLANGDEGWISSKYADLV